MSWDSADLEAFQAGLAAASSGRHEEAIGEWSKIKLKSVTSSALEANLGKSYFELKKFPQSVRHFELAIYLNRLDSESRKDLTLAQFSIERGLGLPTRSFVEWGPWAQSYLRQEEAWVGGFAGLAFFIFLRLFKKSWAAHRKIQVITISVSLFFFLAGGLASQSEKVRRVVIESPLRSVPLESVPSMELIPEGTRIIKIRESGNFTEIERPGVFKGWIETKSLEPVFR